MSYSVVRWGALWKDRFVEHLLFDDHLPVLFRTRHEARLWIHQKYGYISKRRDLRIVPHYWRLPVAVRVKIQTEEGTKPNGATMTTQKAADREKKIPTYYELRDLCEAALKRIQELEDLLNSEKGGEK